MSYQGYVILEHDDMDYSVFRNAFLTYKHRFSIMAVTAYTSSCVRHVHPDWRSSEDVDYWETCSIDELWRMLSSGRVDLQNHSVSHISLACLTSEELHLRYLKKEVLGASEWIKRQFGIEPTAFTPPFIEYLEWQKKYFDKWFRYWVETLHSDWRNWIEYLNEYPPPRRLKALYLSDAEVERYGWRYIEEMIDYLKNNEKLTIILTHGVSYDNTPNRGRNISPENYSTLLSKLDRLSADGKLIRYTDLP